MLKRYKNKLIDLIKKYQFFPTEFEISELHEEEVDVFRINYKNSPFTFNIFTKADDYHQFFCTYTLFAPKFPISDALPPISYGNFEAILVYFILWLGYIQQYYDEQSEPDLLKDLIEDYKFLENHNLYYDDIKPFTANEKELTKLAIYDLELDIINKFELGFEEKMIVENRLLYLNEAVDRLNKRDWKGLAISTIIGISIALEFDSAKGKDLINLFNENIFD